jgi:hypothetical protein
MGPYDTASVTTTNAEPAKCAWFDKLTMSARSDPVDQPPRFALPRSAVASAKAEGRVVRTAWLAAIAIAMAIPATAHDLEKTQVSIVFSPDGSFVADVANDPSWLALRLESIPGPFADRVVFWVDGREIRPESVEFLPADALSTYRLRGHMPMDTRTLRWFYGLVIDPYPLTIRRADGRVIVEEVQGDAWSRTIDLSGQFHAPLLNERMLGVLIAALLLLPIGIRLVTRRRRLNTEDTKDTKEIRRTA